MSGCVKPVLMGPPAVKTDTKSGGQQLVPLGRQQQQYDLEDPGRGTGDSSTGSLDPVYGGSAYRPGSGDAAHLSGYDFDVEHGNNSMINGHETGFFPSEHRDSHQRLARGPGARGGLADEPGYHPVAFRPSSREGGGPPAHQAGPGLASGSRAGAAGLADQEEPGTGPDKYAFTGGRQESTKEREARAEVDEEEEEGRDAGNAESGSGGIRVTRQFLTEISHTVSQEVVSLAPEFDLAEEEWLTILSTTEQICTAMGRYRRNLTAQKKTVADKVEAIGRLLSSGNSQY